MPTKKTKPKTKSTKRSTRTKTKTKTKRTTRKTTKKFARKSTKSTRKKIRASATTRKAKTKKIGLSHKLVLQAYFEMLRARLTDQKIMTLYKQNKAHFHISVAGHEAVQVAAGLIFKPGEDWFYPYYRDMALVCTLGMTTEELILNGLNKVDDPNSHGRQMPMHYGDVEKNIVSQSSPTGTQFNQAAGCALGAKLKKTKDVTYVSAGEGACSQGGFHEALNSAAIHKLPIVFLIERNEYAISVPISEQIAGESVSKICSGYDNVDIQSIDGTNLIESYTAIKKAYTRAKNGRGPSVIEASVPRLMSHSISDDHKKYRTEKEIAKEQKRDPIPKLKRLIVSNKIATRKELNNLEKELSEQINTATLWAEEQADPAPETAADFTFTPNDPSLLVPEMHADGEEVFMVDALNHALDEELDLNPNTYVFGQDVAGGKGGVFSVTSGLTKKHGKDRVFNAQLAEASIVGNAVGMAVRGLNPIPEIQFGDYVWTAMMQIRNEMAMMSYRSAGDFTCPFVVRIPVGGYIHGACYHSQCIDGTFTHFPGLYVIMPSNATDAKGLLKSAIRSNNPVLFLEHKGLYRQPAAKGPEGGEDFLTPIGKAKIVKEGKDLTIVSWGVMLHKSLHTAKQLEAEGLSVEVIDLRTLVPLDLKTIFDSVKKTNRVMLAHEDVEFMGFGAEIAGQIASECFEYLDAPIKRLGREYVAAIPHSPILEEAVLPQDDDVLKAAIEVLEY